MAELNNDNASDPSQKKKYTSLSLPEKITLKHSNGQFMRLYSWRGTNWLTVDGAERGAHTVFDVTYDADRFPKQQTIDGMGRTAILKSPDNSITLTTDNGHPIRLDENHDLIESADSFSHSFRAIDLGTNQIGLKYQKFVSKYKDEWLREYKDQADSDCTFEVDEPIADVVHSHFKYDKPSKMPSQVEMKPDYQLAGHWANTSTNKGSLPLKYEYTETETGTWNETVGGEVGFSWGGTVGVPEVVSGNWEFSVKANYSNQWGGSKEKSKKVEFSPTIEVAPRTHPVCVAIIRRYQIELPYSYQRIKKYTNGTSGPPKIVKGVYNDVDVGDVKVESFDIPLDADFDMGKYLGGGYNRNSRDPKLQNIHETIGRPTQKTTKL